MNAPFRFTLYGDRISGNCHKVQWTAARLGYRYDWVDIDILKGETRTADFRVLNPAGQVPVIKFDDGRTLAQSNAIILHLNDAAAGDLTPREPFDRAKMIEWLFWEQYTHEKAIAVRRFHKLYLGKSDDEIDPVLMDNGKAALALMDRVLSQSPFFVGDAPTLADVALLAYSRLADEGGFDLDAYGHVQAWIARSERALDLPSRQGD